MAFHSSSSKTNYTLYQWSDRQEIEKIAKKLKSGDEVTVVVGMGGWGKRVKGVLWIDYCTSGRVWWVKPFVNDLADELVEPEYSDDHPLFGIVPADHGVRRSLADLIEEATKSILDNHWVAPSF